MWLYGFTAQPSAKHCLAAPFMLCDSLCPNSELVLFVFSHVFTLLSTLFCFRKFFEGNSLPENWAFQCASGKKERAVGASFAPFFVRCQLKHQPRCSGLVKADIEEWKRHSHLNPSFRNPGGRQNKVRLSNDFSLEPHWKQPGSVGSEGNTPLVCVFIASIS